jgi:hypothetical protein
VEFVVEPKPGTAPILEDRTVCLPMSWQNSRPNYKAYWKNDLSDRVHRHGDV